MIVGIGTDIVIISRFAKILERYSEKFIQRIFSAAERAILPDAYPQSNSYIRHIASRFAAKEAAAKALGTGFTQGVTFKNVCILSQAHSKPILSFTGKAHLLAEQLDVLATHLSITHERDTAVAFVVLEK